MMKDIIIVGGGHAGVEAAHIATKMGKDVLLITMRIENIVDLACNPSIGGTSKGVIVREVDALGGLIAKISDKTHYQIKMLNSSKGPAVRSLRAQVDKLKYQQIMIEKLKSIKNLEIKEGKVEDLIIKDNKVLGVVLDNGEIIKSKIVILTTGTYTKSNILIGDKSVESGPHGEERSNHLTDNLKRYGLDIIRLKTGTPPRIKESSIDFSKMKEEPGSNVEYTFSFDNKIYYDKNNQKSCYLIYTNEDTHKLINENLKKSSMYSGIVTGTGARYCPSIEDKLVRFQDKERHQLFLEPESELLDEWYLQGLSTSLPEEIQEKIVKTLPGLENAVITKYAYAIEYDAIDPIQLNPSLENKYLKNLFTAGQINGTSGYEEAAAQGIIAGINAVRKLDNLDPLILKRSDAYIGVLIDDLVTKGTIEPYRMLTSRAEFRLILRHDNADIRLRKIAYNHGSITNEEYNNYLTKLDKIKELKNILEVETILINKKRLKLNEYLKRPEIKINNLKTNKLNDFTDEIKDIVETEIKYEGYIKKTNLEIEKLKRNEEKKIPEDINYLQIKNIANEAKEKLIKIKPKTIAQAMRISGVNPSDIAVLSVYIKKEYH